MAKSEEAGYQNKARTGNHGIKSGDEEEKDKRSIFVKKSFLVPAAIILLFIAGAVFWYAGQIGYISTDDAFVDANRLNLSSKILGRIARLAVREGDSVKTGQLVVVLDSADLKARENESKSMLNTASESIALAKVRVAKAQEDFKRAEKQYNDKVIPKEKFDHSQKTFEAAQAEYNIDLSRINSAYAQLKVLKTKLLNTRIYSPMDGVVAKRWVLQGDVVTPGQPIFTIYNLKNIWVIAELEETDLASVKLGDNVDISVDAYPDLKFKGTVFQIGSGTASEFSPIPTSNASGSFSKVTQRIPVKISIAPAATNDLNDPPGDIRLLPGMSVETNIKVGK